MPLMPSLQLMLLLLLLPLILHKVNKLHLLSKLRMQLLNR